MKIFTVDDYFSLDPEDQTKINDWMQTYKLANVIMVTSQSSMVENEMDPDDTFEEDHVAVYADILVKRFITPTEFISISNSDVSHNAYIKIAEFFFDDFPWPDKEA